MANSKGNVSNSNQVDFETLIENGIKSYTRTMIFIVGNNSANQVVNLYSVLFKLRRGIDENVSPILWCYKNEVELSSIQKKRKKEMQKKFKAGKVITHVDPFDDFVKNTHYCCYTETSKIIGQTYGVCVLQDFEALSPNRLAQTIETVEGGGLVIFLLNTEASMIMDIHRTYKTEVHGDIVGRFNERLILSLSSCKQCVVVDDTLNVLPISSHVISVQPTSIKVSSNDSELESLVDNLKDSQPIGSLVSCCKTLDQSKALLKMVDILSDTEQNLKYTVSLTGARGRGKSAALGLAVSAAVAFGYTPIFVTSPSPSNLKTFFEFVFKGFDSLGYKEGQHFGLVESSVPEHNKAIIRVNIFKNCQQFILYLHPTDASKLSHAELLVIDEAATIPLTLLRKLLGPYLVFFSSTVNGYEGTGRSVSLKLLSEIRNHYSFDKYWNLSELTMEESIRYKPGDAVEQWLNQLLCFNVSKTQSPGYPDPSHCDLYYINRDTLFSYHKASEKFLQKMIAIYASSSSKYSPNDIQLISDAPAHHLFCLLEPMDVNKKTPPEILCVIQVCLEGELSSKYVSEKFSLVKEPTSDLIPWKVYKKYLDENFPSLPGLRIVRIATCPERQSIGYETRALSLLIDYYNQEMGAFNDVEMDYESQKPIINGESLLNKVIEPRTNLPPLLMKLNERTAENVQYLGVSYGLSEDLLRFWEHNSFVPVDISKNPNELTGEHSCVMIRDLSNKEFSWPAEYWYDFQRRFISHLSIYFRNMPTSLALSILNNKNIDKNLVSLKFLDCHLSSHQLLKLEQYCKNLVDYHLIDDLLKTLSRLYFLYINDIQCYKEHSLILLGIGLQHKNIDNLSKELDLTSSQTVAYLNQSLRKIHQRLTEITVKNVEETLGLNNYKSTTINSNNLLEDLQKEMDADEKQMRKKQHKELLALQKEHFDEFSIQGTEEDWGTALSGGGFGKNISIRKRTLTMSTENQALKVKQKLVPFKKKKKSHKKSS